MLIAPPSRLGPYEILTPIGVGGMGMVYRARDTRLDRDVAVKMLPQHLHTDEEAQARFAQEAKAVAALNHPNVLAIFDFGSADGLCYAVTELLEGETLRERLRRGPIPWTSAVAIFAAFAEGLAAAHAKGIVHRDLKPENLFLCSDGRAKILDFGLAVRPAELTPSISSSGRDDQPTPRQGVRSEIAGTVAYMAPEILRGSPADEASDLFALGCVFHETLTATPLFLRQSVAETMMAILTDVPPDLVSIGVPTSLSRLIARCLDKCRDERYQNARDLVLALETAGGATVAPPPLARRRKRTIESLAVLPFSNRTVNAPGEEESDYLSDGITEHLINSLSQLPKIRVVPRSTVFRYKGRDIDPAAVGRHLRVQAVLTGRITLRGDHVTVQAELIDVESESQLWGEQYRRATPGILEIEQEIGRHIFEHLKVKLTGAEKSRLRKRQTTNREAYQLYLKGRYHWNKRSESGLKKGVDYFHRAIETDPTYALAYSGLSDSYAMLGYYSFMVPGDAFPRSKAAAKRALELEPSLAEAHTSLAEVMYLHDWDWREAEKSFRQAISINPNYATAHHWYGLFLSAMGKLDQAAVELRLAETVDPLSLIIATNIGTVHYFAGDYEAAVEQFRRVIDMEPMFGVAHLRLGEAYERQGRSGEAIAEIEKAIELTGGNVRMSAVLAVAQATAGNESAADAILDELLASSDSRYVSPYDIATVYAGLGKAEDAFLWLERAYEEHSHWLVWLQTEPKWSELRQDPRFNELAGRVGLKQRIAS